MHFYSVNSKGTGNDFMFNSIGATTSLMFLITSLTALQNAKQLLTSLYALVAHRPINTYVIRM